MTDELRGEGGETESERFWEKHYRERERVWSGKANLVLVEVAGPLPSGTALDLGCGEGGDAIWLAQHGWRVTAVDVSATALDRAATYAAETGVAARIDFQRHDLAHTFPTGAFDLVSAQYLHSPIEFPRERVLQAAARTVTSGGLLLVVAHARTTPNTRSPAPEEALHELDLSSEKWITERLGAFERRATNPNGEPITFTDIVVAARRRTQ